jgi:hypothetical protein
MRGASSASATSTGFYFGFNRRRLCGIARQLLLFRLLDLQRFLARALIEILPKAHNDRAEHEGENEIFGVWAVMAGLMRSEHLTLFRNVIDTAAAPWLATCDAF